MQQCCVFGCRNIGNHSFPKDKRIRKLWEAATRCKNFRASKWSKICSDHFKPEDYVRYGLYTGLLVNRILKKGTVPSVFTWSKTEDLKCSQRRRRAEARAAKREDPIISLPECNELALNSNMCRFVDKAQASTSSETAIPDFEVDCVEKAVVANIPIPKIVQNDNTSVRESGTQKNYQFFAVESFRNDDKGIDFYTGLESFKKFMFVFDTLCPEAYSITYSRSCVLGLSVEDQFFLTLIKLKRNKEDYELGRFFDVSPCTVSDIFITWINFMHQMWSMLNIWPTRELVNFYMSGGFKQYYPSTRVIGDHTENPIQRPVNLAAQRKTLSSYKNHSTIKIEVEASPSGLISHCSDAYAGSTSDKKNVVRSQLYQKSEKGDSIMADRGFNMQDIFAHKGVTVNIHPYFKGKCQLPGMTVVNDPKLSSKRIHIERLKELTKTYFMLHNPVNSNFVPLMSKIYFVCIMLCNFRENFVTNTA
ncbi:uncharacterized protein LOC128679886 [Plodia interpunctella]|uniref:uncharacterized protein LOC128679886 n=1 Tax=Plodia interpunctella TaxID=58824 RepID=UPI0023683691|nr:uncharacterized protein LOC128679886 [Plodia interpunctella]